MTPSMQFFVGVVIYNETLEGGQLVGYIIVWVALLLFGVRGVSGQLGERTRGSSWLPRQVRSGRVTG